MPNKLTCCHGKVYPKKGTCCSGKVYPKMTCWSAPNVYVNIVGEKFRGKLLVLVYIDNYENIIFVKWNKLILK